MLQQTKKLIEERPGDRCSPWNDRDVVQTKKLIEERPGDAAANEKVNDRDVVQDRKNKVLRQACFKENIYHQVSPLSASSFAAASLTPSLTTKGNSKELRESWLILFRASKK